MPLPLPPLAGFPLVPVDVGLDDVLSGARVTDYRFDLLNTEDVKIGELHTVSPGGSIDWDVTGSIKGSGQITVTDLGEAHDIDWLNVRIRPVVLFSLAGGGDPSLPTETPLGIFIPAAPVEKWTATGRTWDIDLLDKSSVLDQDIYTEPVTGLAQTYTAPKNTNIIDAVRSLIVGGGESAAAIADDTPILNAPLTWDVSTTRLKIINDLLDAGNYLSLWVDGEGQFRATPYTPPIDRPPSYEALAPFTYGPDSLMAPEWERDRDYFSIPNRYVAQSQGDGDTEAITEQAVLDPASPFSFESRGRWITVVETGVEAADALALHSYAVRQLAALTSVTSAITLQHAFLPDLLLNTTVRFTNAAAGIDTIYVVTKTSVPFDPVTLCQSQIEEATAT